ncbi:MAG: DUF2235 domain-containing protein [Bdellovibrionales bacterium]
MAKNIVIFSDGTGQKGGLGANTNIYKIFNVIEDRSKQQISFYDPGIGNEKWRIVAKGTGLGITQNIKDCYNFIFENYESGDKIFLFGFSRGAATVRSLTGMLHLFGVLPKSRRDLVDQAYEIYKTKNYDKRRKLAKDFIDRHHTMWAKVEFLGVFDTVAALGLLSKAYNKLLNLLPWFKNDYHDFSLSESVVHGRQALAIDEERLAFRPVLWDPAIKVGQSVKQVWFLGVHTDVGGGYGQQGLSDISLKWMLDEAVAKGLKIYQKSQLRLAPNADEYMNEEKFIFFKWPYRTQARAWPAAHGLPLVHKSVLQRRCGRHNDMAAYKPWILNGKYEVCE